MTNYRVWANSAKIGGRDEVANMLADTPEQAITKLRIVRGEDFYRRMYMVCIEPSRNHLYSEYQIVKHLSSWGLGQEQLRRDGYFKSKAYRRKGGR